MQQDDAASVFARIEAFHRGRDPERIRRKYRRLLPNPWEFFQGTAFLFYQDWPTDSPLNEAPPAWLCGDLHPQNVGSFKGGDNDLTYFDIDDFDEGALGPCAWDLTRLLTSIFVARSVLRITGDQALLIGRAVLDAYAAALVHDNALWIERKTARGIVRRLMRQVARRGPQDLLEELCNSNGKQCYLRITQKKLGKVPRSECKAITQCLTSGRGLPLGHRYQVFDIARRFSGRGALDMKRYLVLAGKRSHPEQRIVLELKEARPSALGSVVPTLQPSWSSEAERIVRIQRWVQAVPPGLVEPMTCGPRSYVLRISTVRRRPGRLISDCWTPERYPTTYGDGGTAKRVGTTEERSGIGSGIACGPSAIWPRPRLARLDNRLCRALQRDRSERLGKL
jgi:uncharacterized protein (DUF2252 family)